ncbi:2-oxoglutarate and Fe(II)-dependent oxygenase superfamily protein, putative [Theobroma cacao]|uniref:2-oxoglutarate and Fe(II)-dependent oxygenase superfamily protein, putative n=2 Tax=Theobroma cacao TaxID=3641 RepID=A0A061GCR5_THECC|nr:2-oxoglutarate and Fe(II)-dependent oxygenase superfamily protein, putative [Theobroma cacao]
MAPQSAVRLPVIDLFDENSVPGTASWVSKCKDVRLALEEYGCFLTPYDKVSLQLQDQVFNSVQELFALPTEKKVQNTSDKPYFGYFKHPLIPLSESMGIDGPTVLEGTQSFTDLMWPNGNKRFCESVHTYAKLVSQLDRRVKYMVFESYGVGKYFDSHIDSTSYLLRLIKYRLPKEEETNNCGFPHTDKSFLTILHDNQVAGLEIKTKDGRWIGVEPSGSMFIVMAGDAFLAWSNGRVHSALHRVVTNGKKERYSLGFFSFSGETIRTPEELIDEAHPLLFKPFENIDLLRLYSLDDVRKYSQKFNDEAMSQYSKLSNYSQQKSSKNYMIMATQSAIKLPVIDLFDDESEPGTDSWISKCEEVQRAFEEYGCFLATYDKVSLQLQDEVFDSVRELFHLPTEKKVLNTSDKPYFGYFKHPSIPLSESMGIDNPTILEGTQSFTNLMWPNGNQIFCESIYAYAKLVSELDRMVKTMVFESYGVRKYYDSHIQSTNYLLRLIKYRVPREDENDFDGCPHTDKSFMTILHDNHIAGLQIKAKDGNWIGVEPSGSMFVVMAGDAFLAWSNGRIQSPTHRVIMKAKKERYCLALFSFSGETIRTPEELVDEAHPLLFKPFDNMDLLRLFSLDDVHQHARSFSQPKCGA